VPLQVDRSNLPILRLHYIGEYSDAELIEFLNELTSVFALPGKKVCVIDLTHATPGSARQRKLQAEWIQKHEGALEEGFAAAAVVTDSAVIRGTVTAVFWLRPLPIPTHVAATVAAAERWLSPYVVSVRRD
jgi:stage II sporulation SpoAA-like protein